MIGALVLAAVALQTQRLPNGMTVVTAPAEKTAIHLTFDAGSRLDPKGRQGTALLASRVLARRLPGFTSDVNQERASFTADSGLPQIREALSNRTVSAAEFERAKAEGGAPRNAEAVLLELVYGSGSHGHTPGTLAPGMQLRDVQRFWDAHYDPASAVLAVTGTFDEQGLASLKSHRARKRCRPARVQLRRERSREIELDVAQPEVHWGYPTAPAGTADWYALNILADIIGQGSDSRLQRRLVAGGLARDFGEGETEWPCTAAILRMRARLLPGVTTAAVLAAVDEELERLQRERVTDAELATARQQEQAWADEQASSAGSLASALARGALFYGDAERVNTEIARMLEVTKDDVLRVANRYLRSTNRGVVIVRPASK